jgi:hypothetical protein
MSAPREGLPAVLIPADPDRDWELVELSRTAGPQLRQLQSAVGGYLEAVRLPLMGILWCNEEGALNGLPLNRFASTIALQSIVGDVIITGEADADGDVTAIDDEWIQRVQERKELRAHAGDSGR